MGNYKHIAEDDKFWIDLGARIKMERKLAGLNQADLMEAMGRAPGSFRVLGKWEHGTAKPQFSDMVELCRVFDCELGYLLGEYDCKTRTATDIHAETGLSEKAIQRLRLLNEGAFKRYLDIISLLINEAEETGGVYSGETTVLNEIVGYLNTIITEETVCVSSGYGNLREIQSKDIEDLGLLRVQIELKRLKNWWRGDDIGKHPKK